MDKKNYKFPFLQITPLNQYPEINEIIDSEFSTENQYTKNNIYCIVANLLIHPIIAVARSRYRYEAFGGPKWYNQKDAIQAQDYLEKKGLTVMKIGQRNGNGNNQSTLIKATERLEDMLKGIVIKGVVADPNSQEPIAYNRVPLSLEEINDFEVSRLPSGSHVNKSLLRKVFHEVDELNKKYFARMKLGFVPGTVLTYEGMTFEEAREIAYKELQGYGRSPAIGMATNAFFTAMFTKRGDGRLFQRCDSFQYQRKIIRKYLTINGQETGELDFSSMHINLSYYVVGATNPNLDDSYSPVIEKLGLNNTPQIREAVKKAILILFNTPNPTTAARALNYNHPTEANVLRREGVSVRRVNEEFIRLNPRLRKLFETNFCPANSLMFYESTIMRNILGRMKEKKINGLPLHDSVIYDTKHRGSVEKIMRDSFKKFTKKDIRVKEPKPSIVDEFDPYEYY